MSFRLVPKSVTLNDLERRNGPYFAEFGSFRGALRNVVESSRSLSHFLMSSCLIFVFSLSTACLYAKITYANYVGYVRLKI